MYTTPLELNFSRNSLIYKHISSLGIKNNFGEVKYL